MSTVIREHREMSLTCKLTSQEVREKAPTMAEGIGELVNMEDEKKLIADSWKKRIDTKTAEVKRLARQVRTETEERPVGVVDEFRFVTGEVVTVRTDTQEAISRRKMKDSERQDLLPLAEDDGLSNSLVGRAAKVLERELRKVDPSVEVTVSASSEDDDDSQAESLQ